VNKAAPIAPEAMWVEYPERYELPQDIRPNHLIPKACYSHNDVISHSFVGVLKRAPVNLDFWVPETAT